MWNECEYLVAVWWYPKTRLDLSPRVEPLVAFVNDQNRHLKDDERVASSLKPFYCKSSMVVLRSLGYWQVTLHDASCLVSTLEHTTQSNQDTQWRPSTLVSSLSQRPGA